MDKETTIWLENQAGRELSKEEIEYIEEHEKKGQNLSKYLISLLAYEIKHKEREE